MEKTRYNAYAEFFQKKEEPFDSKIKSFGDRLKARSPKTRKQKLTW